MLVLMVNAKVKPGMRDEFVEVIRQNAAASATTEEGNFGFYVVQHNDDPDRFFLFEIYRDEAALEVHRTTPHFLQYRRATAEMLDGEPARVVGTTVWPPDGAFTK